MQDWQKITLLFFGLLNFLVFVKAFYECKFRKNAFGETPFLLPLGIFVWGDGVIFGIFWILVSLLVYFLSDWLLFPLTLSIFWLVRSLGETIYWFNQQFSSLNRNPPEKYWFYRLFQNDSVWFVFQISWQCVTVISLILTLYFAKLWLQS